jgi:hypothetical protein
MPLADLMFESWAEGRTRLTNFLQELTEAHLPLKLHPDSNSIGFLIRHCAETELLFAANFFGAEPFTDLFTLGKVKDDGRWTNLQDLISFLKYSETVLSTAFSNTTADAWSEVLDTRIFGIKTRIQLVGRIISHTGYHAGQIGLIKKYA